MRSSCVRKGIPGLLLVCLFLLSGVPASGADKLQPFTLSVSVNYITSIDDKVQPGPWVFLGSNGLIVIDTATGQVVSSSITTQQGVMLPLISQQNLAGNTQLTFGANNVSANNGSASINLTLYLVLPVASLVGYTAGPICDFSGSIPGCNSSSQEQWLVNACSGLGCGGGGTASGNLTPYPAPCTGLCPPPPINPVPFVNSPLVPSAKAPGGPAFTLTVNGTGFVPGAVVNWNGSSRVTNFVTNSQLNATILASDVATAQTATITVVNPVAGSSPSNRVFFPVSNPTTNIAFQTGPALQADATGDFTGTGKLDLLLNQSFPNTLGTITYYRGNGDGTFQPATALQIDSGTNASSFRNVAVGDVNGDGKLDVIVTSDYTPPNASLPVAVVSVLLGNGDGTFQPFRISGPWDSDYLQLDSIRLADLNGDGKIDLVTRCFSATIHTFGVCVNLGNGDGTFATHPVFSRFSPTLGNPGESNVGAVKFYGVESLAIGDFNGDGKLDLAASSDPAYVSILLGNGDGTFGASTVILETYARNAGTLAAADFNGDGKLDLAYFHDECANQGKGPCEGNVDLLVGNGDGTFQAPITITGVPEPLRSNLSPLEQNLAPPVVADFNGDGILDLAVADHVFLLGNGPAFSLPASCCGFTYPTASVLGDFNGDGKLDLAGDIGVFLQVPPAPDFKSSGTPPYLTVVTGSTASFTVTITGIDGFSGVVQPSLSNLPPGTTVTFSPSTVTGSGSILVTIATSGATPTGSYLLNGTLTSGSIVHAGHLTLNVGPAGTDFTDFVGSFNQTYQNISPGSTAIYQITIHPINGFTGDVSLSLSGLPSGATATFNPSIVSGGSGPTTLTVATSPSTPNGQYFLLGTGTSGSHTHNATLTLNVNPPGTYFGDFGGTITPVSQTIRVGQAANFTVTIYPLYGFNQDLILAFKNGYPLGITPSQNPTNIVTRLGVAQAATLTLQTDARLAPGTYTINFTERTASPPDFSHDGTVTLIVTP